MVKSCSASGRARIVSFSSLGSSFVKVFVFQTVIFCCIVVRIVSVYQKLNFDMLLSFVKGEVVLIIRIYFVSSIDLFSVGAFLNFVSVSISTSSLFGC